MKAHVIILYLCLIIFGQYLIVNAIRKNELKRNLKKGNKSNPNAYHGKGMLNFEIMKDNTNFSNIQLKASKFFDILGSTRLMQNLNTSNHGSYIYRYVHNVHDHNENNGAMLVFLLFFIFIFAILFFIFYFIFKRHVNHIRFMNS
ncbi:conserved Plasmodium protein, unknown function [Plasmodium chabaudi chabaudi]|uniref:Uncharacterized protein n=1 Tax=Plasmodium chabaudi chabaudi TaxID=31271 RepID=A0A1C6YRA8_PLACU|nr:conserved Plasmodium protein, unknown function [Plasmodium chabaudi chabaudi]